MKNSVRLFIAMAFLLSVLLSCQKSSQDICLQASKTALADPFLGVENGNVIPGASLPFGMTKVSPNVSPPNTTNAYRSDRNIVGFAHNQTSGTGGGPRYGNILVIPQAGRLKLTDYISLKKVNERATPGYYGVRLARKQGDVECEVTTSQSVGFHRYEFFTWSRAEQIRGNILIDVSHTATRGGHQDARCMGGEVKIISDNEIAGEASFKGGWGADNPYTIYFYAQFDKSFKNSGVWLNDVVQEDKNQLSTTDSMQFFGAFASFDLHQNEQVQLKVAISYISIERAKENMQEIAHWDFERAKYDADRAWNDYLSRVDVQGGTAEQQKLLYACLRNTLIMPTRLGDENPEWKSDVPHYWDHYCIWDVFRTAMPLHTLIIPDMQTEVINNLLDIYKHKDWLPDSWVAGNYSNVQGGSNADVVIADAVVKGLGGFDKEKALEAMRKNAEVPSDRPYNYGRYLEEYLELGYLTSETTNGASSATMEYAYNDFCIGLVAQELGYDELAGKYMEQSTRIFNLFYDSVGYFWAKDREGNWESEFTLKSKLSDHWNDPYFYEGGSEMYSYYVPHDMQGLINRHGGNDIFIERLDRFFDEGRFDLGNEPLFLVPYSYHYAQRPDKTAVRVREILTMGFNTGRDGLPGQDDSGALSSWYVFSAIGIFPVAGQDVYLITSPLFEKIALQVWENNKFHIIAHNTSYDNIFIQKAKLNGKTLNRSWLTHDEIAYGGKLELFMGDTPSNWGQDKKDVPPSLTKKEN
jgi:predicted alpha-1,2-mannosidase